MCVWYLRVWPLSAWVPARQQVVGSPALRDYLVLFLYFLFYWSGVVFYKAWIRFLKVMSSCLRQLHFRWVICHFVALACLHIDLFGVEPPHLKDSFFPCLVHHCLTPWSNQFFLTTFKPFDLYCNLLAVIHHNWVIRINFYHCLVKYLKYTCFSYFVISVLRLSMNTTSRQLNTKSTIGKIKVVLD